MSNVYREQKPVFLFCTQTGKVKPILCHQGDITVKLEPAGASVASADVHQLNTDLVEEYRKTGQLKKAHKLKDLLLT